MEREHNDVSADKSSCNFQKTLKGRAEVFFICWHRLLVLLSDKEFNTKAEQVQPKDMVYFKKTIRIQQDHQTQHTHEISEEGKKSSAKPL